MSSEVFARKESVYFVSGAGGSTEDAGGCTLEYVLNNGGFENFNPDDLLGDGGVPLCESEDAEYEDSTGVITAGTPGDFIGSKAGMVAFVGGLEDEGRYEILEADTSTGNWIRIEAEINYGDDEDCDIYVGGAFNNMETALDQVTANDADGAYDCYLFTNYNETVSSRPSIDGGGNIANNTKLFITGYNTNLLDMMPGGAYYQSVIDAWYLGIDADCHVEIDLDDIDSFRFDSDCVIVRNIRITNRSPNYPVEFSANVDGILFHNCIIDNGEHLIHTGGTNIAIYFIDCFFFDCTQPPLEIKGNNELIYFIGCIVDMGAVDQVIFSTDVATKITVTGCLLIGGKRPYSGGAIISEWNNTLIAHASNTTIMHQIAISTIIRMSYANIVILMQAGVFANFGAPGGCLLWDGFNCIWGVDGAEYTGDYSATVKAGGSAGRRDFSIIDVDPELDSSYRPRNPQVLRGGSDGRSQLGAIKQKYQFPQKGRIVNHGRVGILK